MLAAIIPNDRQIYRVIKPTHERFLRIIATKLTMSTSSFNTVVVGVDVGGPKKGFHAVALREGQFLEKFATLDAGEVLAWCRKLNVSAIGIDAPCCWSRTGCARPCERALAAEGIHTFATPSQAVGFVINFIAGCATGLSCSVFSRLTTGCSTGVTRHRSQYVSRPFLTPWHVRSQVRFFLPSTSTVTVANCCAKRGSPSTLSPVSTWWIQPSALTPRIIS